MVETGACERWLRDVRLKIPPKEETAVGSVEKQKRRGIEVELKGPVLESWRGNFSAEAPRRGQELM